MSSNALVTKFEKNQQAIAKLNKEIEREVGLQLKKLETLKEQDANMRVAILEAMEANGVTKFDGDLISITYVAPSKRNIFDSTRFKEAMPKTYAKFLKVSEVKSSIRLKVKA